MLNLFEQSTFVSRVLWLLVAGLAVTTTGCETDVMSNGLAPSDTNAASDPIRPSPETVVIRFSNLTATESVQVEFYASNTPLTNVPADLFVPQNLVTRSVGFAGTGIIQPNRFDIIEFPCTPNMTIGTTGGTFVDHESGEARGVGDTRWAQEGPLALCGSAVSFDYAGDGTVFTTVLDIFSAP